MPRLIGGELKSTHGPSRALSETSGSSAPGACRRLSRANRIMDLLRSRLRAAFSRPAWGAFLMPTAEVVKLERESLFKAATAALGTAATYLCGGWDAVFKALVVLACMDYVTGWAAAWVHGRLSSDAGRRGIARKVGMFVVVAVGNILDQLGGLGEPILRTVAIWWYIG